MLAACVLHNICISEDDGDLLIEPQQPNAAENFDDIFPRDGHELQGVQLRQQLIQQLGFLRRNLQGCRTDVKSSAYITTLK